MDLQTNATRNAEVRRYEATVSDKSVCILFKAMASPSRETYLCLSKGGKFLKKLWCCVGGSITR